MAVPKLSAEQWAKVRSLWERDARDGFTWVVKELALPVSPPGVRKKATQEGWAKVGANGEAIIKPEGNQTPKALPVKAGRGVKAKAKGQKPEKPAKQEIPDTDTSTETRNQNELKPFKTRETPILDQLDIDEPKQGLFVREYVKDLNRTQSAIRAGYSVQTAQEQSSRLLSNVMVQAAIMELRDEVLRKLEAKVEELVEYWLDVLRADPNEITSYRRDCCPHCWGAVADDGYRRAKQFTPAQYDKEKIKHDEKRARLLGESDKVVDIGEFPSYEGDWFDCNKEPNPDCPECRGNGSERMFIADTRNLPPGVARLFNGAEMTDKGVKILMSSKEKAADQLGRFLGAFKERDVNINVTMPSTAALEGIFHRTMQRAKERQQQVNNDRGIDGGDIIDISPDEEA